VEDDGPSCNLIWRPAHHPVVGEHWHCCHCWPDHWLTIACAHAAAPRMCVVVTNEACIDRM